MNSTTSMTTISPQDRMRVHMHVQHLLKSVSGFIFLLKLSQLEGNGSNYENESVVVIMM